MVPERVDLLRLGALVLLALAAAGCMGSKAVLSDAPPACATGELPASPYDGAALLAGTRVAPELEDKAEAVLDALAQRVVTLDGARYASLEAELSRWSEEDDPLFFRLTGKAHGGEDLHEAIVHARGRPEVEPRAAGGTAVPAEERAQAEAAARSHPVWPRIQDRTPHLAQVEWSAAWPGCLRLVLVQDPRAGPSPTTLVYVARDGGGVPEGGVLHHPAGTEGPPERW